MRYQALLATRSPAALGRRCELLGVSRSGYDAWRRRRASARAQFNRLLVAEMERIHAELHRKYGSPRMHPELEDRGFACGQHRVARPMRAHRIRAKQARRFRITTDSAHPCPVAPNHLARQFTVAAPNRVWMGDVTYVPTAEGWCYLAVLLDAFSRRVVGWALDRQLTAALPRAALERALATRRPPPGVLHHSDRGIQPGLNWSSSKKGDCWDNAVVESFFHSLKVERLHERRYATREQLQQDLEDYIERFYNRQRRHSTLGYLSPAMFELQHAA